MARTISWILFDCDGTLVNSEKPAMGVAIDVLADAVEAQRPMLTLDRQALVQEFTGGHFDQMLSAMESRHGVSLDKAALSADKTYRTIEALKLISATPGMANALARHDAANGKRAIVTSSEFDRVNVSLIAAGLDGYFPADLKFSAHDTLPTPTPKPDPSIYLHALKALKTTALDSVAVEDSATGTKSARAAGIDVVGFVGADHISDVRKAVVAQSLLNAGAAVVISHMDDLEAAVAFVADPSVKASFTQPVFFNAPVAASPAATPPAPQP
ncbi:MAG: putative cytochrome pisatin demethylase [Micavibrio sp.]|nr:putative cytochrome pisatin demethylase [Micavibrio sp.]